MLRSSCARRNAPSFRAADIVYKGTRSQLAPPLPPLDKLGFGMYFTNHMLVADWHSDGGWKAPICQDFGNLSLPPQCGGLHYALQCYEGLKAYLNPRGEPVLFRPDMNAKRMLRTGGRLVFPSFDEREWVDCVRYIVDRDKAFIPKEPGYSLYVRPAMIGTNTNLRIGVSDAVKFLVILSPVGPYYQEGFKPVKLYVEETMRRSFPGGTGGYKIGANYAPTVLNGLEAQKGGYAQVLWLHPNGTVDEVGAMNFMVLWRNEEGDEELITAPIDGTVLPGITRDSVLALARGWGEFKVSEKRFHIDELTRAIEEGRVREMFGCGTAAVVSPVKALAYKGVEYAVPVKDDKIGPLAQRLWDTLMNIQLGRVDHPWCVRV